MSLQNIIKSWITTLIGMALFCVITYGVYDNFNSITMPQVFVVLALYIIAGGLMFVSDSFFKSAIKKLSSKL